MKKSNKIKLLGAIALAIALLCSGGSPSEESLRSKAVKLVSEKGSCSGQQVHADSGVDYILTAAHCRGLASNGSISAISEDGKTLPRRIIAEDAASDLLLLEGLPGVRGLKIAQYSLSHMHVRTFTHGHGMDLYKTEGELLQDRMVDILLPEDGGPCLSPKASRRLVQSFFFEVEGCVFEGLETVTTAHVIPGSSGGMVVNDSGELVGVVSAGDGEFGLLVRISDIKNFLHNY